MQSLLATFATSPLASNNIESLARVQGKSSFAQRAFGVTPILIDLASLVLVKRTESNLASLLTEVTFMRATL